MTQTWFITGSSRGLGRALTVAALRAGNRVAATARRPEQLDDLVTRWGERILPLRLDVTDPEGARRTVQQASGSLGGLDVVVNNAGYANVAPIETADDADVREQFETNFWGVYNVSKAALPILRLQGRGLFIQISSIGGRVGGSAGIAPYQAAKFAIDGFSRVLRTEAAPFGVKVLVVEPSGFRTDWAGASMTVFDVPEAYEQTVGAMHTRVRNTASGPAGDPERAAEILVQVAGRDDIPHNLPLGVNASDFAIAQDRRLLNSDSLWASVGRSADYEQPYPGEYPASAASPVR
jgi:NAD(P)-dependent dehydrogenase (short-subunit alcohol dehydrogenase family)